MFALHCVAPATADPSKLIAVVAAGAARKPVKVTVVPVAPEVGEIKKKFPVATIVKRIVCELVPSLIVIE